MCTSEGLRWLEGGDECVLEGFTSWLFQVLCKVLVAWTQPGPWGVTGQCRAEGAGTGMSMWRRGKKAPTGAPHIACGWLSTCAALPSRSRFSNSVPADVSVSQQLAVTYKAFLGEPAASQSRADGWEQLAEDVLLLTSAEWLRAAFRSPFQCHCSLKKKVPPKCSLQLTFHCPLKLSIIPLLSRFPLHEHQFIDHWAARLWNTSASLKGNQAMQEQDCALLLLLSSFGKGCCWGKMCVSNPTAQDSLPGKTQADRPRGVLCSFKRKG